MDDKAVGLVLVSHGNFAGEALKSAEMIMGCQDRVRAVAVMPGMDLEQVKKELDNAIDEVSGINGVIIMTDIIGGTPTNAGGYFSMLRDNVAVITGFNMPMLLEFFTCRCASADLQDIMDKVGFAAQQGIVNITNSIKKQKSNI